MKNNTKQTKEIKIRQTKNHKIKEAYHSYAQCPPTLPKKKALFLNVNDNLPLIPIFSQCFLSPKKYSPLLWSDLLLYHHCKFGTLSASTRSALGAASDQKSASLTLIGYPLKLLFKICFSII